MWTSLLLATLVPLGSATLPEGSTRALSQLANYEGKRTTCWMQAVAKLRSGCSPKDDQARQQLALAFANCQLAEENLATYGSIAEVKQQAEGGNTLPFSVYTYHLLSAETICLYLSERVMREATHDATLKLHTAGADLTDRLRSEMDHITADVSARLEKIAQQQTMQDTTLSAVDDVWYGVAAFMLFRCITTQRQVLGLWLAALAVERSVVWYFNVAPLCEAIDISPSDLLWGVRCVLLVVCTMLEVWGMCAGQDSIDRRLDDMLHMMQAVTPQRQRSVVPAEPSTADVCGALPMQPKPTRSVSAPRACTTGGGGGYSSMWAPPSFGATRDVSAEPDIRRSSERLSPLSSLSTASLSTSRSSVSRSTHSQFSSESRRMSSVSASRDSYSMSSCSSVSA